MHGVVDHLDPDLFIHRNMLASALFVEFLERRPTSFGSLEDAAAGRVDALTIDDAIGACRDAALLARERGHRVTLFINPFNVELAKPYWFYVLNVVLDRTPSRSIRFAGKDFALGCTKDKEVFRKAVKARASRLPDEEARASFARELADALGVHDLHLPKALQPLTAGEIRKLVAAGVRVENHGWTHGHPEGMEPEAVWGEIERGKSWLQERLGVESRMYAVPFGTAVPPHNMPRGLCDWWYLADSRFFAGQIGKGIVNRKALARQDLAA
jgi:hypothetical protein